jgi:Polyketide cyclase / dehydrase and lipid transport
MTRWYPLEPADAEFFTSAPYVFRFQKRFAAPPEQVWESLTSDASLAAWGPMVKAVNWTSPRPFGVGTTREVTGPALTPRMRERYFRWDEGRRHSFAVYESTGRLFKRFAEDYIVEPDSDGTLFTWTVAIEPKGALALPFKAIAPALKAGFGRLPRDGQRYFAKRTQSSS